MKLALLKAIGLPIAKKILKEASDEIIDGLVFDEMKRRFPKVKLRVVNAGQYKTTVTRHELVREGDNLVLKIWMGKTGE